MTPHTDKKEHNGSLVDSTVELGVAAAKFAMDQVDTVLCAVNSPGKAMDRVKRSMDHFTDAMNASVEAKGEAPKEEKEKTGRAAQPAETEPEEAVEVEVQAAAEETATFTGRKT